MASEKKRKHEDSYINPQAAGRAGGTTVGLVNVMEKQALSNPR